MSIIDTLITDRTAADTAALEALFAKAKAGTITDEEWAVLTDPTHKGAYNYTDLNRVSTALEYLRDRLNGYGYATPGYRRIEVPHRTVAVSKLPEGFTELAYIESSGTQYIDTAFKPNQNTRICMKLQSLDSSISGWAFGGRISNTSGTMGVFWYTTNSAWTADYDGNAQRYSFPTSIDASDLLNLDFNKNVLTINGSTKTFTAKTFQNTTSLTLLAVNTSGAISGNISAKLYSCQIYDNGTLVRDFVPVISPDGAYGLYDVANSKFYSNAGSGAFTGGAVVDPPIPSDPSDDETRDPFLWYEDDIPTPAQMAQYIANVIAIRSVLELLSTTPEAPGDMEGLTVEEANAIEFILIDVQTLINNMVSAWFYSGDLYAGEV